MAADTNTPTNSIPIGLALPGTDGPSERWCPSMGMVCLTPAAIACARGVIRGWVVGEDSTQTLRNLRDEWNHENTTASVRGFGNLATRRRELSLRSCGAILAD
jgi:hypothetical protein